MNNLLGRENHDLWVENEEGILYREAINTEIEGEGGGRQLASAGECRIWSTVIPERSSR